MGNAGLKKVLAHLRETFLEQERSGLSDAQLLTRFIADREEAAFAALVRRHGLMVLQVCFRVLGHVDDAEDAFQATFLVLAQKAASVVKREAVASFLYGVAYRTALRAKARALKRRAMERQVETMPHPSVSATEAQDWRPLFDQELNRLPDRYRAAVILCDLEGKTRREAARQLRLSEGTLSSRLARARRLLARRLAEYGLAMSGGALAVALSEGVASATVPPTLAVTTVKAAALAVAGQACAATPVATLVKEVMKDMLLTKLKVITGVAMIGTLLGGGGVVYRTTVQAMPAEESQADAKTLRRENELLKINIQVLLEKVRAQEAELTALRGQADHALKRSAEEPQLFLGQTTRADAYRKQSQNNLKQIGLAMHNYHDVYQEFPSAAICSRDGKPLLSWRVAILPFVEQRNLYEKFNLDEPWDSEHNKRLLPLMPKIYALPGVAAEGGNTTHYRVFVGPDAGFLIKKGRRMADITDGLSNTWMVVEARESVPWTKPDELHSDRNKPLPRLGNFFNGGFNAVFMDGSVRFSRKPPPEQTIRALITPAGGEIINNEESTSRSFERTDAETKRTLLVGTP
jgi:RNA polymerase sigma factor (sigma-70 family)